MQNLLRHQPESATSYNLVEETQQLLMGFRQNETAQMKNKSTTVWKSLQTIHRSDVSKTHDFRSGALVSTQRTDMDTNYGRGDCGQSTQFCWTRPSVAEFLLLILSCLTAFCEGPCKENQESVVNPGRGCLEVIVTTVLSRLPQFCRDGKQNQRQYELAIEMKVYGSIIVMIIIVTFRLFFFVITHDLTKFLYSTGIEITAYDSSFP